MGTRAYSITVTVMMVMVVALGSPSSAIINNLTSVTLTTTTRRTITTDLPRTSAKPIATQPIVHFLAASPPNSRSPPSNTPSPAHSRFPPSSQPSATADSQCLPFQADGKADSEGITVFGLNMFRTLVKEGNVFFSPFNLWSALALTFIGAEGQTRAQMSRLLGLRGKRNSLEFLNGLENELSARFENHKNLSLDATSRVYINKGFEINPCIHSSLSNRLETIDFSMISEAADTINHYVNSTTKGLIPSIVTPSQLSETRMAIISAIYFYGSWVHAFDPELTHVAPFHPEPNAQSTNVNMMFMKNSLRIGKSNELNARVLRLPYTSDNVAMYVLLPNDEGSQGFDATVRALSPATLRGAIGGLSESLVEVRLPKFKMDKAYQRLLHEAIKGAGATDMFDRTKADFSSFSKTIYVSTVAHKAFVDVSEAGTEAAAVTAVLLDVRSSRAEARPFTCDRPFIFVIYDDVANVMLFMGAYKSPPPA